MKLLIPFGTRPEIIKLSPVIERASSTTEIELVTIHTMQHYDASMSDTFLKEFGVEPTYRLAVPRNDEYKMFAAIYSQSAKIVKTEKPDVIFVVGDTNTVPIFCLLARKFAIPVAHIEAGLRSFNELSVEEVNRKIGGATALLHFAPTELNKRFLVAENVPSERIFVVGNTIIDVLKKYSKRIKPLSFKSTGKKALFTVHRPTNVDSKERLEKIVRILENVCENLTVIFPVHPRTKVRLLGYNLFDRLKKISSLVLEDPLPYFETLSCIKGVDVIITDSGGLQEEASYLKKPIITLRGSTPRWETVLQGTNILADLNEEVISKSLKKVFSQKFKTLLKSTPCPYGDGNTANRILDITYKLYKNSGLRYHMPSFVALSKNALRKQLSSYGG